MLAIIDYRTPEMAIKKLASYAEVLLFRAQDLVMPQLDGHPDIFLYQDADKLILAPNTPLYLLEKITKNGIKFQFGQSEIGLIDCTNYNCVSTSTHFIHQLDNTDPVIRKLNQNKKLIHTRQAFTRCSLTALSSAYFISSDKNIERALIREGLYVLYANPEMIELPGFRHGLFGGTNGILDGSIFFNGNLDYSDPDGRIRKFISDAGLDIIQLHNGPLFDGGSIFFVGR